MTGLTQGSLPPRDGRYLVIDKTYRAWTLGTWRDSLGWWIRGSWLGRDAVVGWCPLPSMPAWARPGEEVSARSSLAKPAAAYRASQES